MLTDYIDFTIFIKGILEENTMNVLGVSQYKALLMENARQNHAIRYCMIELLDHCNYKCDHCYVHNTYKSIIKFNHLKKHIDELVQCGCVWVLLSGGEPLIHPNFKEIYLYIKNKGINVSIFTNGYYIDDEIMELFINEKPDLIEISIYGSTSESYDKYVGIQGAFDKVNLIIDKLIHHKINLKLKTILTTNLIHEFTAIKDYVETKKINFRYDGFIVSKINGDKSPCINHAVDPNIILKYDCERSGFIEGMKEKRIAGKYANSNKLYTCDAGYNSVFINAQSYMSICSFARHICVNLLDDNMSITKGQKNLISQLDTKRELTPEDICYKCSNKDICRYCPGQFLLQNGSEYKPIEWNCHYAKNLSTILDNHD